MKSLLYISILLITACNLSAQQVIKGTVTDAGNGPAGRCRNRADT